eukprot:1543669-Pyramimonas_sp.AAC.1
MEAGWSRPSWAPCGSAEGLQWPLAVPLSNEEFEAAGNEESRCGPPPIPSSTLQADSGVGRPVRRSREETAAPSSTSAGSYSRTSPHKRFSPCTRA